MNTTEIVITQDNLCSYRINVGVSNGKELIEAHYVPCLAYGTDPGNNFTADGFCSIYDMIENLNNLPSIVQTDTMELNKSFKVNVESINGYSFDRT